MLSLCWAGVFVLLVQWWNPLPESGFISYALYLFIKVWTLGKCQLLHTCSSLWIPAFSSFLVSEEFPHFPASSEMNFKRVFSKILDPAILGVLCWEEFPCTSDLAVYKHCHRSQRVWLCVALRWISSNEVDYALLYSCFMTFTQSSFSKELDYLFSEILFNIMDTVFNGFLSQKHRITLYFYIALEEYCN